MTGRGAGHRHPTPDRYALVANLKYKAFSTNTWWTIETGDAYNIDDLFEPWVTAINLNASQQARPVERIYSPVQGAGNTSYMGNLSRFPVGTDKFIHWLWAGTPSGMRITFSEDWQYSVANSGYGGPNETKEFVTIVGNWEGTGLRAYLIGSSVEDNREFFAVGWDTGSASQYHNAMIVYKDRYGGWAGMYFGNTSATGLFFSATNDTYNAPGGSNLPIASTNILLPMSIPFISDPAQDYVVGQYISQPASLDLFALASVSEFGKYVTLSPTEYCTSLGYNAFWVRHGVTQSNINTYQTFAITVVTDPVTSVAVYHVDGVPASELTIQAGLVYAFDQSDPSNLGDPLAIFTEDPPPSFQDYSERNQLGAGVLVQGTTTYLSVSTISTDITELWYDSETRPDLGTTIVVQHETPAPTPTPAPDTPTPTPAPDPLNGLAVTVAAGITNPGQDRYFIGVTAPSVLEETPDFTAVENSTIQLDQSDSSNAGHPIAFYTDASKTTQLTTGYTFTGTAGSAGAFAELDLSADPATYVVGFEIFYQCQNHSGMGHTAKITVVEA